MCFALLLAYEFYHCYSSSCVSFIIIILLSLLFLFILYHYHTNFIIVTLLLVYPLSLSFLMYFIQEKEFRLTKCRRFLRKHFVDAGLSRRILDWAAFQVWCWALCGIALYDVFSMVLGSLWYCTV